MKRNVTPGDKFEDADGETLDPDQELALAALISGQPVTEAAKAAGCSRCTIWRWMTRNPVFAARLNQGKREVSDQIRAELQALGPLALSVIRQTLRDGTGDSYRDFQAAVKALELLTAMPAPTGPVDAQEMAVQLRFEADQREGRDEIIRATSSRVPMRKRTADAGQISDMIVSTREVIAGQNRTW